MTDGRLLPFLALVGLLAAKTTAGSRGVVRSGRHPSVMSFFKLSIYPDPDATLLTVLQGEAVTEVRKFLLFLYSNGVNQPMLEGDKVVLHFCALGPPQATINFLVPLLKPMLAVPSVDDWTLDPQ